jgi:phytoene dehydrogenase-like protein
MKKILVIGSGIGGSAVGALIAKETEHQVHCFEQAPFVGGRCGSYTKTDTHGRAWTFDVGCHAFSTCDKGPFGELAARCGKEIRWSYFPTHFPESNIMGVKGATDKSGMTPTSRAFMEFVEAIPLEKTSQYDHIALMDLLDQHFRADQFFEKLGSAMAAGVFFGTDPFDTSAGEYIRCMGENSRQFRNGYPLGGTGAIPEAFCETITENRGKVSVALEGRVKRIVVQDHEVKGIIAGPDERFYDANIVISNADIKTTALKLVGKEHLSEDYVRYIEGLQWGAQVCTLKLGLDAPLIDEKFLVYVPVVDSERMMQMYADAQAEDARERLMRHWRDGRKAIPDLVSLLILPVSNHDTSLAPEGRQNLHVCTSTALGKTPTWSQEENRLWEKAILRSLDQLLPGIEDHIVIKDFISATQLAARFGKEGAGTGTAQSTKQVGSMRPPVVSPVKGLYYCSADAGGWGIGTELAARSALELFHLLKENDFDNDRILHGP